jgi:hypothetical protein
MVLLIKWVPWSVIKILGHPNLVITCSNKKCVVVFVLQSLTNVAYAHLVKYSFTIMIYIYIYIYIYLDLLVGGLIGLTKSIFDFSNT